MMTKKKNSLDALDLIRYGLILVLILYTVWILMMKGKSRAAFEDVAAAVENAAGADSMTKGGQRDLKRLYGLNMKDYADVSFYYTEETMGVEELLLVRTVSETDVVNLEKAIRERRDTQIENFDGYGQEQVNLLKNSIIKIRGNDVLFIVSPEADKAESAFSEAL